MYYNIKRGSFLCVCVCVHVSNKSKSKMKAKSFRHYSSLDFPEVLEFPKDGG